MVLLYSEESRSIKVIIKFYCKPTAYKYILRGVSVMKKSILLIRSISLLGLLVGLSFIVVAPKTIALHIAANNIVDSTGSKYMLLLEPALLIIVNEVSVFNLKRYRKNYHLTDAPIILVKEWYLISAAVVLLVVFGFLMYEQVTLR